MTPADLKVRREALGLTQSALAVRLGVSDRTIRHWESGTFEIPEGVDDDLLELEVFTDEQVALGVSAARGFIDSLDFDSSDEYAIRIKTYATDADYWAANGMGDGLTAAWHRRLVYRISEHFSAECEFTYDDDIGVDLGVVTVACE